VSRSPDPAPDTNPDPFDALGLEPRFDLTRAQIESAYLARIAGAHPDHAGDAQGPDAAALNDARRALLGDERRANLVLDRLGGPSASADKALPDGFLMEIMEVRSAIEDAIASGGDAEREKWQVWADEQRAGYRGTIASLFGRAATAPDPAEPLAEARRTLNAWRYIERLIEQLDPDHDPARADFAT
jgi:molecular chaperone HscB